MNTAIELIRELEAYGAYVDIEGEQLKLIRGKSLPTSLLDKARMRKADIVEVLERDQKARKAGFVPLLTGEVYERQYSLTSHVFIMMESNEWNAWRESWQQGTKDSASQKQIAERVNFDLALVKANQYIQYLTKRS